MGEVYVKAYFSPESKAETVQMVKNIEDAMDKNIDTLTWISPETKVRAKEKLRLVVDKIGYPGHWRDYSSLQITRGNALGNALRAVEFENHRQLAKIGKPVDRGEWGMRIQERFPAAKVSVDHHHGSHCSCDCIQQSCLSSARCTIQQRNRSRAYLRTPWTTMLVLFISEPMQYGLPRRSSGISSPISADDLFFY
jgi:hypothetical protein